MKSKLLNKIRLRSLAVVAVMTTAFAGQAWGEDMVYKTALFGEGYTPKNSAYDGVFKATNGTFVVNVTNFNNNNNGWKHSDGNGQIKCGRKNNASVGTIITEAPIDKAITKVVVTIDAITVEKVNSIKLYTSSNNSTWTEADSFDKSTGAKVVSLTNPTANLYYKVAFDCASGSSNGLITISKVEYYSAPFPVISANDVDLAFDATSGAITFSVANPVDGGQITASSNSNWLVFGTAGENLPFTCTTNESKESRSAIATLTYTYNTNETATKEVTITQAGNPNGPGTLNNPYTVAQAIANTPSSGSSDDVYIRGVVSSFYGESIIDDGSNYRYYISDNGGTATQLLVYKGKKSSTDNFSSADDLLIGDEVIVCGKLTLYSNAPELASGNYIVSRATKADPELAFATTTFSANIGEDFTAPTLTNPHSLTVTYSSSDEDLALVDENTGEVVIGDEAGEVTITATFAGNSIYRIGSASYTITIIDPNAPDGSEERPYSVSDVIRGIATGNGIFVRGYIVGNYNSTAPITSGSNTANTNLALADSPTEATGSNTIPVELPSSPASLRSNWGPASHLYNNAVAQVIIKANASTYFSVKGLKGTSEITKVAEYVTVTSAGYATYYTDCALDFTGTGITASTATCNDGGDKLVFAPLDVVPANTGVLLHAAGGASVAVPVTATSTAITDNCFVGTLTDIASLATADGNYKNYILNNKDGNVGFYWANGQKVGAHRAYAHVLTPNSGSTQSFISINPGEESGIENVSNSAAEDNVYDLQGRRVAQPQKGLYIVNGKKVIIK